MGRKNGKKQGGRGKGGEGSVVPGIVMKDLQKEFADRVLAIGRILSMLEPWADPGYVRRAWYPFELYTAITKDVEIDIILSPAQAQASSTPTARTPGPSTTRWAGSSLRRPRRPSRPTWPRSEP